MVNPGGNYPGRQIGVGRLKDELPAFTYLVTGRSKGSQERYASLPIESPSGVSIRIKSINPEEPFDQFRHYRAVVVDPETGFVLITNNEAMVVPAYEALRFCRKVRDERPAHRIRDMLSSQGPEYDSKEKPTPRIIGAIYPDLRMLGNVEIDACLGITTKPDDATMLFWPLGSGEQGRIKLVQTYNGDIDYKSFDPTILRKSELIFYPDSLKPQDLAEELYATTNYTDPKYGDLRACVVAGVKNGNGLGGWEIARKNRYPNVE